MRALSRWLLLLLALLLALAPLAGAGAEGGVLTGIDVLRADGFQSLQGRRVGLITNQTGVDRNGTPSSELLQGAPGVRLVALFSPEHGLRGQLDVEHIGDSEDPATGTRVYSLYGATRQPTADQLDGIDTLVFDIQDIGSRFYTYISTLGLAMQAAAENGLRLVVLDRPNPIDGVHFAGPVADDDQLSFTAFHALPVRHGMTTGELARMFQAERQLDLDLEVIAMQGWRRDMYYDATGLRWINPSPNMRSLAQALLYPGIGLLETTNLSVGRGTDTPFEVFGAPWLDGDALARTLNGLDLPGVAFVPVRFTPDASKFAGESCGGVNVIVTQRDVFEPVRTGLEIALRLRADYPDAWDVAAYGRLLASAATLDGVRAGQAYPILEAAMRPQLAHFAERRQRFLLYP